MSLKKIIKMFEKGSVCIFGMRGSGKDMLTSNIITRRKLQYVSNINYGGEHIPLKFKDIDCSGNTYENFISGKIRKYICPYKDKTDIYISDGGIYLPSQYCNELNKKYPNLPTFLALSRQLCEGNVHFNTQALNRMWDKVREQSDQYILCLDCKVILKKIIIQKIRIYERYETALAKHDTFKRIRCLPLTKAWNEENRAERNYYADKGKIENKTLVYIHRGRYNTRHFRDLLASGSN